MDCKCRIENERVELMPYIVKCPLCRSAPKLLEACKVALLTIRAQNEISVMRLSPAARKACCESYEHSPEIKGLIAAIAAAEAQES